jgi:NAD(P)H-nitrite reductase large subunit/rubredoxin
VSETNANTWRCTVCGYIHRGEEPPKSCPICGAVCELFEPFEEAPKAEAKLAALQWRCLNCGYIHTGDAPPEFCPVCGVPAESFEPVEPSPEELPLAARSMRIAVLGAGIAGIAAVESLRKTSPDAEITLISKEKELPYYRLNLTRYLAGEIGEADLPIHPESWYDEQNIRLLRGEEAKTLNLDKLQVALRSGDAIPFERLVLTVGAHPFIPPFPGAYRQGVFPLRTIADAHNVLDLAQQGANCIVIGGGLLGIETAGALAQRGAKVTLLEGHEWLMPRQLNATAGELLRQRVLGAGIDLRTQARTEEILGDERVRSVKLEDGAELPADLVIIATGIRTNSYLARLAGLEVNRGIVVDNNLMSSHPSVLAAGDVAEHRGLVYGIWGASQFQGSIAGMNALGAGVEFGGIPRSNTLKVLGLDLFSIGTIQPEDGSYRVVEAEGDGRYDRFLFRDSHLVGAILLGDAILAPALKHAIETRIDFGSLLKKHPSAEDVRKMLAG